MLHEFSTDRVLPLHINRQQKLEGAVVGTHHHNSPMRDHQQWRRGDLQRRAPTVPEQTGGHTSRQPYHVLPLHAGGCGVIKSAAAQADNIVIVNYRTFYHKIVSLYLTICTSVLGHLVAVITQQQTSNPQCFVTAWMTTSTRFESEWGTAAVFG